MYRPGKCVSQVRYYHYTTIKQAHSSTVLVGVYRPGKCVCPAKSETASGRTVAEQAET